MVILHGPEWVDVLVVRLAAVEPIPLVLSRLGAVDGVVLALCRLSPSVISRPPSR